MRLAGGFSTPEKRVAEIRLRVSTRTLPVGAKVSVTDIQLQAGNGPSGKTYTPEDVNIIPRARQWVNGTITHSQPIMLLSNMLFPSGIRLEALDADTDVQLGSFRFGHVSGEAYADGEHFEASQGWGHLPVITPRSDLQIDAEVGKKIHLRASWDDRRDTKDVLPSDEGTVTGVHPTWQSVLIAHGSWKHVVESHEEWRS